MRTTSNRDPITDMRVGRATGEDWLRLGEAAEALSVNVNTVRRWSDAGKLTCYRSPGGHRRYRRRDVDSLLRADAASAARAASAPRRAESPPDAVELDRLAAPLIALARTAAAGVGAGSCRLTVDGAGEGCWVLAVPGGHTEERPTIGIGASLPAAAEVLRTGRRIVIPDVSTTSLLTRDEVDAHCAHGDQAVLAVPIALPAPACGALELIAVDAPRSFDGAGVAFAEFMARQTSLVIAGEDAGYTLPPPVTSMPNVSLPSPVSAGTMTPVGGAWSPDDDPAVAELITGLQRRNRDLSAVVDASLGDAPMLSMSGVLQAVVERLAGLVRAPVVDVYAVEGDTLRALMSHDGGCFDAEWEGVILPLRRYPCSRRAVEASEITVATGLDDPTLDAEGRHSLEKWGYQSQLSMPLISRGRVIGLLELSDYEPRDFTPDLDLIRGLGRVATRALENGSLFEQAERRGRILDELVELGALAARSRDLDTLVRGVAERLVGALDSANCDIYTVSAEGLRCVASYDRSGHDEAALGTILDADSYPTVIAAMNAHEALAVSRPDDPKLSERERRAYRENGFESEVCVPLVVNDRLYGMLDIYDTRERDYGEFLSFLQNAAQTVAGAVENAQLVERLGRDSRVLRATVELGAATSQAADLSAALAVLAQKTRDTVGAADCDVFALQGDRLRCLVSADTDGLDASVVGRALDMDRFPATDLAVRSGRPMTIGSLGDPRLTDDERADMAEYGFQSELCIPLMAGDTAIGLIDVFDTRPRDYDEYLDFLRSVAQTAVEAIERAMLLDELERRSAELDGLVELGAAVSSAGGLTELARAVGPRIVDTMDADGCQIFILRSGKLHCVLTYEEGRFEDEYVGKPLELDLFPSTRDAISRLEPLVIESPDDPRLSDYERGLYLESGSQSEICVPFALEGRVVGLLDVYDHRRRDYARHRGFLMRVGQMMAGAFENALLMEQLEESNQTLGLLVESGIEFGATLDLDGVLESVAGRLCSAAGAPNCDIFTLHGDSMRSVCSVEHGTPDPDYVGADYRVADLGLARLAIESRRPVAASDISTDPRVSDFERAEDLGWGHRAMLDLPLVSHGEVIGLAAIYDDHPRDFERLDLLHSLAQVAATALANATLFDRLERGAERMKLVGEASLELSSSLDLEEILLATARRLSAISRMPMCDIYTLRDGGRLDNVTSIDDGAIDRTRKGRSFPLEDRAAARLAVESGRPVVIESRDDPRLLPAEVAEMTAAGETGGLIVPLIAKERVMGVVELSHRGELRRIPDDETSTIVSICRFAALAIDNAELYQDIKTMHLNNLKALSSAMNAKDYYTLGHAARVAAYMVLLGNELGWPDVLLRRIEEAAYLHDIGKIGVSDRVLLKPSGLNRHEWELMRQHPIFSADIIRPLFDDELVAGVRHHHERWAGDGYPDGLAGEEIPLIARAMCVADSYDAMSLRRPYRQGLTYDECVEELERCSDRQFDPAMVAAFKRVLARIAEGRRFAAHVAAQAATALDVDVLLHLQDRGDERRAGYAPLVSALREVSAANPPAHRVTAFARRDRKTVVLATSAPDSPDRPRLGEELVIDDELADVFAGRELPANVLLVDQWGVWISGAAPVTDRDGAVVAVVSADVPATAGVTEVEGLRSNVEQTVVSMLQTAALQSGRVELEAITDSLTGLYNHRYFHERLEEELERCREHGTSLAVLFCDLDDFRSYNERHGHGSGDRALRAVARVLEHSIRHVDLAARYGGEEFAAILIDTSVDAALEVAERIRSGIVGTPFASGTDSLSVSIGVATHPGDATLKDELIDKADRAMCLAKRSGRNQVTAFGAEHGPETPEPAAAAGS